MAVVAVVSDRVLLMALVRGRIGKVRLGEPRLRTGETRDLSGRRGWLVRSVDGPREASGWLVRFLARAADGH